MEPITHNLLLDELKDALTQDGGAKSSGTERGMKTRGKEIGRDVNRRGRETYIYVCVQVCPFAKIHNNTGTIQRRLT